MIFEGLKYDNSGDYNILISLLKNKFFVKKIITIDTVSNLESLKVKPTFTTIFQLLLKLTESALFVKQLAFFSQLDFEILVGLNHEMSDSFKVVLTYSEELLDRLIMNYR